MAGPRLTTGNGQLTTPLNPYNCYMQGKWSTEHIGDKLVGAFELPALTAPSFGLLFLHDADGQRMRDYPELAEMCAAMGFACLCPEADHSWWTDKICNQFDPAVTAEGFILDSLLPLFAESWKIETHRIGLLGFGMGGQGVLRLAFKHPGRFLTVAAVAAALDYHELYGRGTPLDEMYDSKEQCRQDTALLHIHPAHYPAHIFFAADPEDALWYRGNDRLHEKLTALGIPHEFDGSTSAPGSSGNYYAKQVVRAVHFLAAGLKRESLHLL